MVPKLGPGIWKQLSRREATGRPLGERAFLERLAALLARDRTARTAGEGRNGRRGM